MVCGKVNSTNLSCYSQLSEKTYRHPFQQRNTGYRLSAQPTEAGVQQRAQVAQLSGKQQGSRID